MADLIRSTLVHLIERYGRDEVVNWLVEVWNQPNIPFWAGTMEEYFKLYDVSAEAVKQVDPRIQVGGPAICGLKPKNGYELFSSIVFITIHPWILLLAIAILRRTYRVRAIFPSYAERTHLHDR